jgi:hypothetical protein
VRSHYFFFLQRNRGVELSPSYGEHGNYAAPTLAKILDRLTSISTLYATSHSARQTSVLRASPISRAENRCATCFCKTFLIDSRLRTDSRSHAIFLNALSIHRWFHGWHHYQSLNSYLQCKFSWGLRPAFFDRLCSGISFVRYQGLAGYNISVTHAGCTCTIMMQWDWQVDSLASHRVTLSVGNGVYSFERPLRWCDELLGHGTLA